MLRSVHILPILAITSALWLTHCGETAVKPRPKSGPKLEQRVDGLYYELEAQQPFTGRSVHYQPKTDFLLKEQSFTNGLPDGYERRWFRENPKQIESERLWVRGDPMLISKWWPNGQLQEISAQREASDMGRPDIAFGSYVKFFPDGRMKFKAHYDHLFRWHGHIIDYDDEGKLMWDAQFKHGVFVSGTRPPEEAAPTPPAEPTKTK